MRRRIGFAMQDVGVDDLATGSELLVLQGRLHGLPRREATRRAGILLELVGLDDAPGGGWASTRAACSGASTWPRR